ncbi:MAG TPA: GTPase [Acidimicrobiia bacterium]|jgi:hypothetical protein
MHDDLLGLLDKVDRAVAMSQGVLRAEDLAPVATIAADARIRLSYPDWIVVVALAGGTGSGKSSLFNAIAGQDLALTGGIRPMTIRPLALVPDAAGGALDGLLDALGIQDRVSHEGLPWLCLIDLPDNDSVVLDHRQQVQILLPKVDMVIWVTDPEKYRDASLHAGHLTPLAARQEQFLFVLNQVDRLEPEDVARVIADLAAALREDGIEAPNVIPTAASPGSGPPMGTDRLLARLELLVRARRETVSRKILVDLGEATAALVAASSGAGGVEFEARWQAALDGSVGLTLDGNMADGGQELAEFVRSIAAEAGGETGDRLRDLAEDVPSRFLGCVVDVTGSPDDTATARPSWWQRVRGRAGETAGETGLDAGRLALATDGAVGDPIRELLAARGEAHAAIADLSLAVGEQQRRVS